MQQLANNRGVRFGEIGVDFTLKYRGDDLLPSANKKRRVHEQHKVRLYFHEQLKRIWQTDNRLGFSTQLLTQPIKKDGVFDLPRPLANHPQALVPFMFKHQVRGLWFIPLITAPMEAHCHLSIRIGRPMKPGKIIFAGGDLDNRLKVLFDALRMPAKDDELPEDAGGEEETFCLLADDDLITKLSIEPHELLTSHPNSHYVEVDLDVKIKAVTPMNGTLGLLF